MNVHTELCVLEPMDLKAIFKGTKDSEYGDHIGELMTYQVLFEEIFKYGFFPVSLKKRKMAANSNGPPPI
jgi:hypothetical protein